ncbi:MAG: hypothetical protein ACYDHX_01930 [Methanothrix sp.]
MRPRDIADRLKDAGMKVDIRTFTTSYLELFHYLEGRMIPSGASMAI